MIIPQGVGERGGSSVKWNIENKGLSVKSQGLASDETIPPHKGLDNGQIMAVVHRFGSPKLQLL